MYKANADPLSKATKGLGNMIKEALLEDTSTSIAATRSEVDSEWSVIQEAAHNCHRAEVAANARAEELMEEILAQRRKDHAERKQENNTHHSQNYWNHDHSH